LLSFTYTVDLATDNGGKTGQQSGIDTGDLRYCLTNAGSGDSVDFGAALAAGTTIYLNPANGAVPITNKNLTIDGGKLNISLDGGNTSRIFNITGGSSVTINNLTLQNGYAANTDQYGGNGGAIYDAGGPLQLNNDYFSTNNAASLGGAVFANDLSAPLSVFQCGFTGNYAGTAGGAIYASYGNTPYNITATNSNFYANVSGGDGGAIYAITGAQTTLEADSCQFQSNYTTAGSSGAGGAIYTEDKLVVQGYTANPSTFSHNTADSNGGAIAYVPGVNSSLTLSDITFDSNSASNNGAGIYVNAGGTYSGPISLGAIGETISGCMFNNNQAGGDGGGLYVFQATAENGTIKLGLNNSTFNDNQAVNGGGIAVSMTATNAANNGVTLDSLTVYKNLATRGGGLWTDPNSNTTLSRKNSIIAGNFLTQNAPLQGADVYETVTSLGNNLIGITDGGDTTWIPKKDITGTNAVPQAAGLDPNGLQNNGGPTQTIALLKTSAGYRNGLTTLTPYQDQRGFTRNKPTSIGAYDPDAAMGGGGGGGGGLGQADNESENSSLNPSLVGQSVTFSVAVTGNGATPTGVITFLDGMTTLGTVTLDANGNASLSTAGLAVGSHTITANYGGDANYTSNSTSLIQTVNAKTTSTTLTSSLNPALQGQTVTFTSQVTTSQGGTPTGTVAFLDGTTTLGSVTIDANGNASFSTGGLSVGSHNITANYSGDANFSSSSASLTQWITQPPTSNTALTSSLNPSTVGQAVQFTATVSGNNYGTPTGTVTFSDGSTNLATVTLDANGVATFTTTALTAGSHTITAWYNGDSTYPQSSTWITQTVNPPAANTTLTSSLNPALPGQAITFTAAVTGNGVTPTGTVTFTDGSTVLATVNVDANGNAAYTTSSLALGSHTITATYNGDSNYGSSSASLMQWIGQEMTSTSVVSSANPAMPGQSVQFTATVLIGVGTPTGSVSFLDGNTMLGSGSLALVNGTYQATFTTSTLALGSHYITAVYAGSPTCASSSAALTQTVVPATAGVTLSSNANPSQPGQPVTFTATVMAAAPMGAPAPSGTITFYNGTSAIGSSGISVVNGAYQATLITTLGSGSYTIAAIYSGDNYYTSGSGTLVQTVGQSSLFSSSMSLSSSASPSAPGQAVTFVATVSGYGSTPSGSVTFLDGTTVLGSATLTGSNGVSQASLTTSALALGTHDITAIYTGDGVYEGNGCSRTQTVSLPVPSTSLASNANPSPSGQAVVFTATVTWSGTGTPTGIVSFYDGATLLGSGTLTEVNGQAQATFTTAALGLGTHTILALYSGDSNFADSGTSLTQTIN